MHQHDMENNVLFSLIVMVKRVKKKTLLKWCFFFIPCFTNCLILTETELKEDRYTLCICLPQQQYQEQQPSNQPNCKMQTKHKNKSSQFLLYR